MLLKDIVGPQFSPYSLLLSGYEVTPFCSYRFLPWYAAFPQAQNNGVSQSWTETSKTLFQNSSFLFRSYLSQPFHHRDGKLTNMHELQFTFYWPYLVTWCPSISKGPGNIGNCKIFGEHNHLCLGNRTYFCWIKVIMSPLWGDYNKSFVIFGNNRQWSVDVDKIFAFWLWIQYFNKE